MFARARGVKKSLFRLGATKGTQVMAISLCDIETAHIKTDIPLRIVTSTQKILTKAN